MSAMRREPLGAVPQHSASRCSPLPADACREVDKVLDGAHGCLIHEKESHLRPPLGATRG